MLNFKFVAYQDVPRGLSALLVGDIGGTNSNFGIASIKDGDAQLLYSMHFKSQEIIRFEDVVQDVLDYAKATYDLHIQNACFAAAGVVSPKQEYCKPTNLNIVLDAREIKKKTNLSCAFIVNDFEVIGYGVSRIAQKDLVQVQIGNEFKHGNKAIIGAGTGLGMSVLLWVESKQRYIPVASEGGHADFAAQNMLELELINFIRETERYGCKISWENILSGKGIGRIYAFLGAKRVYSSQDVVPAKAGPHPDEIFTSRNIDKHSGETAELYAQFYGRAAKNLALSSLALGGIYIAGGIASHNVDMFKSANFLDEFSNCGKQAQLLKSMPIWVIADYNVSLFGAIEYMRLEGKCVL